MERSIHKYWLAVTIVIHSASPTESTAEWAKRRAIRWRLIQPVKTLLIIHHAAESDLIRFERAWFADSSSRQGTDMS